MQDTTKQIKNYFRPLKKNSLTWVENKHGNLMDDTEEDKIDDSYREPEQILKSEFLQNLPGVTATDS